VRVVSYLFLGLSSLCPLCLCGEIHFFLATGTDEVGGLFFPPFPVAAALAFKAKRFTIDDENLKRPSFPRPLSSQG
jgi:hypothetical protein